MTVAVGVTIAVVVGAAITTIIVAVIDSESNNVPDLTLGSPFIQIPLLVIQQVPNKSQVPLHRMHGGKRNMRQNIL